jgi:hypothetical protein
MAPLSTRLSPVFSCAAALDSRAIKNQATVIISTTGATLPAIICLVILMVPSPVTGLPGLVILKPGRLSLLPCFTNEWEKATIHVGRNFGGLFI